MNDIEKKYNPKLSSIVAGCMLWGEWGANLSTKEVLHYIEQCMDIGVTTFDHADIYGDYSTEKLFGDAINGKSHIRNNIQLVTKCGIQLITSRRPENEIKHYTLTKEYIVRSAEQSLKNLSTDYIDLFLIHRPSPLMHPEEIAEAFTALKNDGKVLSFGVSNFTTTQFDMLHSYIPLITNQIEVSALKLDALTNGTLDQCLQYAIRPMAYSVLAGGTIFRSPTDPVISRILTIVTALAEKYGATVDQILVAWVLKHPAAILPIIGSTKIERMKRAIKTIKIQLTDQEWFTILEASVGNEVA